MALITSQDAQRIEIPHEAGQWVRLRPLRAGDLGLFESMADGGIKITSDLLAEVVVEWSYGAIPEGREERRELMQQLDMKTFLWFVSEIGERLPKLSGLRSEEEKGNLDLPSSPTTDPDEDGSPESSGISG